MRTGKSLQCGAVCVIWAVVIVLLGGAGFDAIGLTSTAQAVDWVYNPATHHWYALGAPNDTWAGAEVDAASQGGHLATVNDSAEDAWIWSTFGSAGSLWIGLNDRAQEGHYV